MDFLGSTTSLILLLLLILTVLLFTRQAGLEKVSIDLVICWVNMYFSEMATIWHLLKVFPTLLLVSTTGRLPTWTSKVFIWLWSCLRNLGNVFSRWLNVSWLHAGIDKFWLLILLPPCQPQKKIIFIQLSCQHKQTPSSSNSKYHVNNSKNIFIQAPHLQGGFLDWSAPKSSKCQIT